MIKVLVVEDSISVRELLCHMLESDPDVRVIGRASNGLEAIEFLSKTNAERPDIVTMDIHMPLMDGYTMTRRIRLRESSQGAPRLPVIAYSAGVTEEEKATCRAAGMDGHIPKPVPMAVLQATLLQWLGKPDREH